MRIFSSIHESFINKAPSNLADDTYLSEPPSYLVCFTTFLILFPFFNLRWLRKFKNNVFCFNLPDYLENLEPRITIPLLYPWATAPFSISYNCISCKLNWINFLYYDPSHWKWNVSPVMNDSPFINILLLSFNTIIGGSDDKSVVPLLSLFFHFDNLPSITLPRWRL